jgi:hypothetical protein
LGLLLLGLWLGRWLGCWLVSSLLGSLGSLLQPSLLQGLLVLGLMLAQELWSVSFLSFEEHCILNVFVTNLWHRAWSLPESMFEGSWAHVSAVIILKVLAEEVLIAESSLRTLGSTSRVALCYPRGTRHLDRCVVV